MRIAVVAASSRFDQRSGVEDALRPILADYPGAALEFRLVARNRSIHFAGRDEERRDILVEAANDPTLDAIWFARGGYGSNRIALAALDRFDPEIAGRKKWLGYSDVGFLLAGLYRRGYRHVAHGPMPKDVINYDDGAAALRRSLNWLTGTSSDGLEPHLQPGRAHAAFNISVLAALLGTPLEPDLADHVLMLEEVDEHLYATDRAMFHITGAAAMRRLAGIRLGSVHVRLVADEDGGGRPQPQPFDETAEEIVARWCRERAIPYLGPAGIGHDSANKVVPFGLL